MVLLKICNLSVFFRTYLRKIRSYISHKLGIFSKGLVHGFAENLGIFPFSYF